MTRKIISFLSLTFSLLLFSPVSLFPQNQLRILIIGAHPDDAEKAGGTAAKYTAMGHIVQLVSVTNGDAGHQSMGGGPLAKRRTEEAPMPVGSAGLLSFYREKTDSIIKIRPELVIIMTLSLIIAVILLRLFFPR